MKTPIQELIDEMQKSPLMFAPALTLVEEMRMLEKEKEVIMDAYWEGIVLAGLRPDSQRYFDH
jgi:hypothetical protein